MCKRTLQLTQKHNKWIENFYRRELARVQFVQSILKMCPRCGTLNQLDTGGCLNCLYQFKEYKNGK